MLGVEIVEQFFLFVLAERSANAHMAHDCAGYARREAFRRRMAARAVLLEYALALILILRLDGPLLFAGVCGLLAGWRAILLCGNREYGYQS